MLLTTVLSEVSLKAGQAGFGLSALQEGGLAGPLQAALPLVRTLGLGGEARTLEAILRGEGVSPDDIRTAASTVNSRVFEESGLAMGAAATPSVEDGLDFFQRLGLGASQTGELTPAFLHNASRRVLERGGVPEGTRLRPDQREDALAKLHEFGLTKVRPDDIPDLVSWKLDPKVRGIAHGKVVARGPDGTVAVLIF